MHEREKDRGEVGMRVRERLKVRTSECFKASGSWRKVERMDGIPINMVKQGQTWSNMVKCFLCVCPPGL